MWGRKLNESWSKQGVSPSIYLSWEGGSCEPLYTVCCRCLSSLTSFSALGQWKGPDMSRCTRSVTDVTGSLTSFSALGQWKGQLWAAVHGLLPMSQFTDFVQSVGSVEGAVVSRCTRSVADVSVHWLRSERWVSGRGSCEPLYTSCYRCLRFTDFVQCVGSVERARYEPLYTVCYRCHWFTDFVQCVGSMERASCEPLYTVCCRCLSSLTLFRALGQLWAAVHGLLPMSQFTDFVQSVGSMERAAVSRCTRSVAEVSVHWLRSVRWVIPGRWTAPGVEVT